MADQIQEKDAMSALESVRGRAMDVPPEDIGIPKVNLVDAAQKGLAIGVQVKKDAKLFDEYLPKVPAELRNGIGTSSLALWAANHLYLNSLDNPEKAANEIRKLFNESTPLRKTLMTAAGYTWRENIEVLKIIDRIRSGQGYKDRADDLVALSLLFQDRWNEAEGQTSLTIEKVKEAGELGVRLLGLLGHSDSEERTDTDTGPREMRDRVWTIFQHDYNELRHAGLYLHRNNPKAAELYMSLFDRTSSQSKSD